MKWKQGDNKIIAETEFGEYSITAIRELGTPTTFEVKLERNGQTLITGRDESIMRATEQAVADHTYRSNLWETL